MENYKVYKKDGNLYVDRVVAPKFTMLFTPKGGAYDGKVVDDTELNRFVAQSDSNEVNAVAKMMGEAGDCASEFLREEKRLQDILHTIEVTLKAWVKKGLDVGSVDTEQLIHDIHFIGLCDSDQYAYDELCNFFGEEYVNSLLLQTIDKFRKNK